MNTFDSTKTNLSDLLREISEGKIQLPDFQRGWVWDDDHIQDLLVSISQSFPIGAVMLLEAGGEVRFQTRPVEGMEGKFSEDLQPERLILDGQQRLTTLAQTLCLNTPVHTRDSKGKKIRRHYYFDIRKANESGILLEDAIVAVDENRQLRSNFGREIALDVSTPELECKQLFFPCSQTLNSDEWETMLHKVNPDQFGTYMDFRNKVLSPFRNYELPVINLFKETTKEAVCLVFEKVNTGGVQLSVFELITASYAADGYNLRDDWFGSKVRNIQSRKDKLEEDPLLVGIESTEFLQAICLLHTHESRDLESNNELDELQNRPISAKRVDVLQLPLSAWKHWADRLEKGFLQVGRFLRKEHFYNRRELPYRTQLVPMAALFTHVEDSWLEPRIFDKVSRWFWCGVLGELYGSSVETRIANDFEDLLLWLKDDNVLPRTVRDANFQADRFNTLRQRNSAAYKAINVLLLRNGSKDWFWKASIKELDVDEVSLDIHHIFPRVWCEKRKISKDHYECVLNKTTISYKANRKIGGDAPSIYIPKIQKDVNVCLCDDSMDNLLESHALSPELLRGDDFDSFIENRRTRLGELIEKVMDKPISKVSTSSVS